MYKSVYSQPSFLQSRVHQGIYFLHILHLVLLVLVMNGEITSGSLCYFKLKRFFSVTRMYIVKLVCLCLKKKKTDLYV